MEKPHAEDVQGAQVASDAQGAQVVLIVFRRGFVGKPEVESY